jgi:hypothetical protein
VDWVCFVKISTPLEGGFMVDDQFVLYPTQNDFESRNWSSVGKDDPSQRKNNATSSFERQVKLEKMMPHYVSFGKVIFPKSPKSAYSRGKVIARF